MLLSLPYLTRVAPVVPGIACLIYSLLPYVPSGAETWVDIAHYGQRKQAWLATFLDLPHGIPSHDTFRRVFSLVDPQKLEACFRQWMASAAPPLPREVVAVDGKTVRRSFDRGRDQGPLHVVSAFATQQGLSLG